MEQHKSKRDTSDAYALSRDHNLTVVLERL